MQLSEKLKGSLCTLFFDIFFNSPALIDKLFEDGIYIIGTVLSNWKQMPKLKEDNKMSRSESDFHYSKNIICSKWCNNKPVLLATNIAGMIGVSNVIRQTKGSATKTPVSCPKIKLYSNEMGGVDIMDKKPCWLQTRLYNQVLLLLENVSWSHRCCTCRQSYYLHETW